MRSQNLILQDTLAVALGVAIGTGLMVTVFALLGQYDTKVMLGSILGAALACGNFLLMALGTSFAADKAAQQDVQGGQALIQLSCMGRMLGLFLILTLLAGTGLCNVITLVVPLVFVRPALTIAEIFKGKGGSAA